MCHSRLPTPETAFSLCASISGNGGQVDRREKSYVFIMLRRKDFSLAQTGFFSPWHCPASVAPGRAGFLYGTGYYSRVAPLAQTGMLKDCGPPFPVVPGRAGRAFRSK
jgi:hypothetical protein